MLGWSRSCQPGYDMMIVQWDDGMMSMQSLVGAIQAKHPECEGIAAKY